MIQLSLTNLISGRPRQPLPLRLPHRRASNAAPRLLSTPATARREPVAQHLLLTDHGAFGRRRGRLAALRTHALDQRVVGTDAAHELLQAHPLPHLRHAARQPPPAHETRHRARQEKPLPQLHQRGRSRAPGRQGVYPLFAQSLRHPAATPPARRAQ